MAKPAAPSSPRYPMPDVQWSDMVGWVRDAIGDPETDRAGVVLLERLGYGLATGYLGTSEEDERVGKQARAWAQELLRSTTTASPGGSPATDGGGSPTPGATPAAAPQPLGGVAAGTKT